MDGNTMKDGDPHTKEGRRQLMDKALAHLTKASEILQKQQGSRFDWEAVPRLEAVLELANTLRVVCAVVDVLANEDLEKPWP